MADDKTTKTPEQPVTDSGPGKETPPAPQAVIENADFVRYIVTFRGSFFSFSYTFPTSIKTLYNIFPVISFTMYLSP